MTPTQTKPSIVFCHGIWADGSCFNKLIPSLQAEGHQVIAVHLSYDTMASFLASYGNRDALEVARDLDRKVDDLLRQAAA